MRQAIFAAALMLAAGIAMADKVRTQGADEIRLYDSPCVHGGVLGLLKPEWRKQFKKATRTFNGKLTFACWLDMPLDYRYLVLFEYGDEEQFRIDEFKDFPGT